MSSADEKKAPADAPPPPDELVQVDPDAPFELTDDQLDKVSGGAALSEKHSPGYKY